MTETLPPPLPGDARREENKAPKAERARRLWRWLNQYPYRKPLWLSALSIAVFFLWAALASINQQVHGTGRIIPAGKVRSIQHLEGGIVNEILVKEGQEVKEGQTLFAIIDKKAQSGLDQSRLARDAALIKRQRLKAEIAGDKAFVIDPALAEALPDIAATEERIFEAHTAEFSQKIAGLEAKYDQKALTLNQSRTTLQNLESEGAVALRQLQIKSRLRASGAISESQYLDADSTAKNFRTQIGKIREAIPITEAEMVQAKRDIDETLKGRQSDLEQELNQTNVEISKQESVLSASKDQVARTVITSPINGTVNKVYMTTLGGVVKPGEVLADIVPSGDQLIVDGKIATKDRGKVWLGLPVIVKVTAYNYALYGGIGGKLSYISADSFTDQRNNEFYQIQATLDTTRIGKDKTVYPGMTVDISILADKISVLENILMPILQIRDTAMTEVR